MSLGIGRQPESAVRPPREDVPARRRREQHLSQDPFVRLVDGQPGAGGQDDVGEPGSGSLTRHFVVGHRAWVIGRQLERRFDALVKSEQLGYLVVMASLARQVPVR